MTLEGPSVQLPEPPKLTLRNYVRYAGVAALAIAFGIGGGELVLGPLACVRFGPSVLWLVTLSAIFQAILNIELIRYAIATGESMALGFTRLKPTPHLYAALIVVLAFLQLGWPYLAFIAAEWLSIVQTGSRNPALIYAWGYVIWFLSVLLMLFGGRVLRILEAVGWVSVISIFAILTAFALLVAPFGVWIDGLKGLVSFGAVPPGVDWAVVNAMAGYAGLGGVANLILSSWYRDKGYGMGKLTGYISTLIGGRRVKFSPRGLLPSETPENAERFRRWFRWVRIDMAVFAFGAIMSMYIPSVIALSIVPPSRRWSAPEVLTMFTLNAERLFGAWGRLLMILVVFWVFFSSQISVVDPISRLATEVLWGLSPAVRRWAGDDVRRVYYSVLAAYMLWGAIAINFGTPTQILVIAANIANLALSVFGVLALYVNSRLLPKFAKPTPLEAALAALSAAFYALLFVTSLLQYLGLLT